MKTAREIHKGNKNRLNLPLPPHAERIPSVISSLASHKPITDVIRSAWGCLVSILSFAVVVGIIIWLLIL